MKTFLLPCLLLFQMYLVAQSPAPVYQLTVHRTPAALKIDGKLDEPIWQNATVARGFRTQFPIDTGLAKWDTEVRMASDAQFLYVGARCYQKPSEYTVQSLRRDFDDASSDVFNVLLNPSRDGLNGFLFGVSPLHVQREALIDNGTYLSYEWDNKWYSQVTQSDAFWTVEMAIPFKTLRYNTAEGVNTWKVNFTRGKLREVETSSWVPIGLVYPLNNLAFAGMLVWETPPPRPGLNASVIPYLIGGYASDFRRDAATLKVKDRTDDWTGNAGADAKVAVTSGLNLDLTVNPDFSQVEVDRQVANLSRFELFFPERRQFFLENRDLFALYGFPQTRPFFSRRIGLALNPVSGLYEKVPIYGGARLSGKLNDNWRLGVLSMQTKKVVWDSASALPGANFGVLTAQRRVFKRSYLGGIFINKQNFLEPLSEIQRAGYQSYNRVAGLEFDLYSQDNRWEGEWYYHRSFSPDPRQRGESWAHFLSYTVRNWRVYSGLFQSDSTYYVESGFIPRPGVRTLIGGGALLGYPKRGWLGRNLVNARLGLETTLTYNLSGKSTDQDVNVYGGIDWKNQSTLRAGWYRTYTYLFSEFDPTNLYRPGELPLQDSMGYTYNGFYGNFTSSPSYNLQTYVRVQSGGFFNGTLQAVDAVLSYRFQPIGLFSVSCTYNRIRLPDPYASADFWLVGPRAEVAFSRSMFASAFFQYNTQLNNFNINARFQWRFAPASDIFLVYTDNTYASSVRDTSVRFLSPKNKAVVLKVVYWFNV